MRGESSRAQKVEWGHEESRQLMEIVLEMTKPGVPTALRWERVVASYNSRYKENISSKQAQNHFHNCRYKWVAWKEMTSFTGIELDEDGLPTGAETESERFAQFFEKHKKVGHFVATHKLSDLDIWNPIFGGKCATGALSFSPASAAAAASIGKRKEHEELVDDTADSDECRETFPLHTIPESMASSGRSPPRKTSSKRPKKNSAAASAVSADLSKAFDIMKMVDEQEASHERKLYRAVKNMEEVKKRGIRFQNKVFRYLLEQKMDKLFVEFETDEEKWDLVRELDTDSN